MTPARRTMLALGMTLVVAALVIALWPSIERGWTPGSRADAEQPETRRRLRIDAREESGALELRFTRPNGATADLRLVRASGQSPWRPEPTVDVPGVVLGDGYPIFASTRFMAVHGIATSSALRAMSPEIVDEQADEVTVIRGWGGEIAVCLWSREKIVRAYLAGEIFESLLAPASSHTPTGDACQQIERLALGASNGSTRTAASAAELAGCPARRAAALERLQRDCDGGTLSACDLLVARAGASSDLWPEVDDFWRWVLDLRDASSVPFAADETMVPEPAPVRSDSAQSLPSAPVESSARTR